MERTSNAWEEPDGSEDRQRGSGSAAEGGDQPAAGGAAPAGDCPERQQARAGAETGRAALTSDAAQRAAFEQVRGYLDSQDRGDLSNEQQAYFTIAAGNAARLSANGNGFSDSELRDFVSDLGPSLAGEVIARARNTPGDSAAGGAVEALGLAARDISRGSGLSDEDRSEWELNSAVALTASPELIDAHLQGPEALKTFRALSDAAHSQYDPAKEAQEEGYNLLRFPEIAEGAAALFEILNRLQDRDNPPSPEELDQLQTAAQVVAHIGDSLDDGYEQTRGI